MHFISKFFLRLFHLPRHLRKIFYLRWNRLFFRINGVQFGKNMRAFNKIYIFKHPSATITIGDNFVFTSGEAFNALSRNIRGSFSAADGAKIQIGHNSGVSSPCLWANKGITIGNHVNIGADCILMDTDAHNLDYRVRRHSLEDVTTAASAPIAIEDDVLIGTRCIILKGVTIGARSVIGAGSVVIKSIPADCIAAGNPCRVIRSLV